MVYGRGHQHGYDDRSTASKRIFSPSSGMELAVLRLECIESQPLDHRAKTALDDFKWVVYGIVSEIDVGTLEHVDFSACGGLFLRRGWNESRWRNLLSFTGDAHFCTNVEIVFHVHMRVCPPPAPICIHLADCKQWALIIYCALSVAGDLDNAEFPIVRYFGYATVNFPAEKEMEIPRAGGGLWGWVMILWLMTIFTRNRFMAPFPYFYGVFSRSSRSDRRWKAHPSLPPPHPNLSLIQSDVNAF